MPEKLVTRLMIIGQLDCPPLALWHSPALCTTEHWEESLHKENRVQEQQNKLSLSKLGSLREKWWWNEHRTCPRSEFWCFKPFLVGMLLTNPYFFSSSWEILMMLMTKLWGHHFEAEVLLRRYRMHHSNIWFTNPNMPCMNTGIKQHQWANQKNWQELFHPWKWSTIFLLLWPTLMNCWIVHDLLWAADFFWQSGVKHINTPANMSFCQQFSSST